MRHNPNQPRLLADFAAVPTRAERAGTRGYWRSAQADLFADPAELAGRCAVCSSSEHVTERCPHGVALTLI